MQERGYNEAKKEIRSVLLTYKSSTTLEEFLKTYKTLVAPRLPSRALGFTSDVQFLQSMPDVVNVCTDPYGKVLLTGIADESSEHIQKLVSKQRSSQPRKLKSNKSYQQQRKPNTYRPVKEQPFLPGTLRAEILKVMDLYHDGVAFSAFAIAYRRKFNKYLPLIRGLDSLDGMISLIPELEVRSVNNEKIICFKHKRIDYNHQENSEVRKSGTPLGHIKEKECPKIQKTDSNSTNIHKSGITEEVLQNFQLLLQKCPEGIVDMYLPPLYENLTKKNFDLLELGYSSVIELVDALPHIFKRILNPNGGNNWIILPAKSKVENFSPEGNSRKVQEGIPPDAASPSLQFIQPKIPENLDLNEFVPVFVSAVINPSLFWFQLQMDDTSQEFENFEKDMGYFYDNHAGSKYKMNNADISIGATCIVNCPDDKQWYRAVIKSIPNPKLVNVLFVDYGSRENVPRTNVHYVRSKYHDYPAHAFKAQLAGLRPPKKATAWDIKAQQRFIQLCECASLMAYLNPAVKDTFSAFLCDTTGDSDIHINDTLVDEGFADRCFEDKFNVNGTTLPSDNEDPMLNRISSETESYLSSESSEHNQHVMQSNETSSCSELKAFQTKRKLVFSPKEQSDEFGTNVSRSVQAQVSKRFVKRVQLCEDCEIHIINLESKLFMTCGELSRLLWRENDSSFLLERLKYKEVEIPFLKLPRESYISLFEQCIWYKIPEYEKLQSSDSSLIVCSVESAFDVLNIFGHPSVCLRLAMKNEMSSFDPSDTVWKEFNYDEVHEKDIEEQLSKLCLYDLKAKNEALRIKRLKLLRVKSTYSTEEITNIDKLQNAIARRMKKIETICAQYSSCS